MLFLRGEWKAARDILQVFRLGWVRVSKMRLEVRAGRWSFLNLANRQLKAGGNEMEMPERKAVVGCKTCKFPDSIKAFKGVMPDPVAKMNSWEACFGPAFSILKPGPSTGLASTSVPAQPHNLRPKKGQITNAGEFESSDLYTVESCSHCRKHREVFDYANAPLFNLL